MCIRFNKVLEAENQELRKEIELLKTKITELESELVTKNDLIETLEQYQS